MKQKFLNAKPRNRKDLEGLLLEGLSSGAGKRMTVARKKQICKQSVKRTTLLGCTPSALPVPNDVDEPPPITWNAD